MATQSIPRANYVPDSEDLVSADLACPHCGERQTDRLIVGQGDGIRCVTCGRTYRLGTQRATVYPISADPESYGCTPEDAQRYAEIIRDRLHDYALEQGYRVTFRLVPETLSRGNRPCGDAEVIEDLREYEAAHYPEWIDGDGDSAH